MKKSILTLVIMIAASVSAFAESYATYVDVFGANTVGITMTHANGTRIVRDEVTLNGLPIESASEAAINSDGSISIKTANKIVLQIPANVQKAEWLHQKEGWFSNGDTRILQGPMIINGQSVDRLVQIHAGE